MKSWFCDHKDDWVSFGAWSTGNNYSIPDGLYYSFPVNVRNGTWSIV